MPLKIATQFHGPGVIDTGIFNYISVRLFWNSNPSEMAIEISRLSARDGCERNASDMNQKDMVPCKLRIDWAVRIENAWTTLLSSIQSWTGWGPDSTKAEISRCVKIIQSNSLDLTASCHFDTILLVDVITHPHLDGVQAWEKTMQRKMSMHFRI